MGLIHGLIDAVKGPAINPLGGPNSQSQGYQTQNGGGYGYGGQRHSSTPDGGDGYRQSGSYGSNGYGSNGYGSNGYGSNGYGSNGYVSNGYGSNGYGSNGYGSNGYGSNGYGSNGYGNAPTPYDDGSASRRTSYTASYGSSTSPMNAGFSTPPPVQSSYNGEPVTSNERRSSPPPYPYPDRPEGVDSKNSTSTPSTMPEPAPPTRQTPQLRQIIAIPQTESGDGEPFIRAYSHSLERDYQISQADFLRFIDGLNTVVIPSAEAAIASKAVNVGSFFVPGVGGMVMGIGAAVPTIGDKLHLKTGTKNFMATANAQLFNPAGLEATMCSAKDLDQFLGLDSGQCYGMSPIDRLRCYGSSITHLDVIMAPQAASGWHARIGAAYNQREQGRAQEKLRKDMQEGKGQKGSAKAEQSFKWLVIKSVGDTGRINSPQQYMTY